MLVLSRKAGESVVIGGGITITVVKVKGSQVRVSIDAPEDVPLLRSELASWKEDIFESSQEQALWH